MSNAEQQTLQNAGNDVPDEQGVLNKIEKVDEGDAEIGAANQTARKDGSDV